MSTASLGASRVGAVMTTLSAAGYRCARISASGQRRGTRRAEHGLGGDVIALATVPGYPHLLVEVGGVGKRVGAAFQELRGSLMPGFAPLVVRFVGRVRRAYVGEDERYDAVIDAVLALRDGR